MSDHITFPEPSTSAQEDGFLTAENMAATSFQAQLEAPIVRKASKPIPKGGNTITSFDGNTDNKEEEGVEGDAVSRKSIPSLQHAVTTFRGFVFVLLNKLCNI